MARPIPYSEQELAYIKKHSKLPRKQLHTQFIELFKRDDVSFNNLNALCKRKGWLTGRTGHFEKGMESWNLRRKGYMGANRTSFKKGQIPHNHKPVGSERLSKYGYIEIKTKEPRTYELKHRVVWQQHNGPIEKNQIITFIDNDPTNCSIENLMMITRQQALFINRQKLHNHTGEVKQAVATLAQLNVVAQQAEKQIAGEKQ